MITTHSHDGTSHTHSYGDFPHKHVLGAVCRREECVGPTHYIHPSQVGSDVEHFRNPRLPVPIPVPELVS